MYRNKVKVEGLGPVEYELNQNISTYMGLSEKNAWLICTRITIIARESMETYLELYILQLVNLKKYFKRIYDVSTTEN